MIKSATAFELLQDVMYNELFRLGHYHNSRKWDWTNSDLDMLGHSTSSKIQESFKELYQFSTLSTFGVNLQKYMKFKLITPAVGLTGGDTSHVNLAETRFFNKDNQNFETSNFCLGFVTELAIKVQSSLLNGLIDSSNN